MAKRTLPLPPKSNVDYNRLAEVTTDMNELYNMFKDGHIGKDVYFTNVERIQQNGAVTRQILPNPFTSAEDFMKAATDMASIHAFGPNGKMNYVSRPKVYQTGSYGWDHRGLHTTKVGGKDVTLNVIVTVTVCGSKPRVANK